MSARLLIVDPSSPSNRKMIAGLAVAGLASGVLTSISSDLFSNSPQPQEVRLVVFAQGAIFGVFVSAYYALFWRVRRWARLFALIAASTAAYFLAVVLSVFTVSIFRRSEWLSREGVFLAAMFVGGCVGALGILTAAPLLLATRRSWKAILARAMLWSLAGGLLGVVGFALGGSLGKLLWLTLHAIGCTFTDKDVEGAVRNETVNVFSLFVVWQTGIAPLLGWSAPSPAGSTASGGPMCPTAGSRRATDPPAQTRSASGRHAPLPARADTVAGCRRPAPPSPRSPPLGTPSTDSGTTTACA